jgi:hypothetical protein
MTPAPAAAPALSTYLNDHHAGAHAALSLIDRLSSGEPSRAAWLQPLRAEIEQERQVLADIMQRLDVPESTVKQVSGWISERLASLKLAVESPHRAFQIMEALEVLSIGILGKQKLWIALGEVATAYPVLADIDFAHLQAAGVAQHARVEQERVAAARRALRPDAAGMSA